MTYQEKLKDPRWQKKRLEIMQRDNFECQICGDGESTLNIHHYYYEPGKEPWEYNNDDLITLCESCHQSESIERKPFENMLLNVLKNKHYFTNEICELTKGLNKLQWAHVPEVHLTALTWFFENYEMQLDIIEKYFQYLNKKHENKKDGEKIY